MPPLWMVVIGLWCSVALASTGCSQSASGRGKISADTYLAESTAVPTNQPPPPSLSVSNQVGGSITIFTGLDTEIASDVVATGVGTSFESALEEADRHFTLTNTGSEVKVEAPGAHPLDTAQLHVRVPPDTILRDVTIPKGNVGVYGRVGGVTVNITDSGSINLYGANGDIKLSTNQGSITAELTSGSNNANNNVTARAQGGSVNIVAVSAAVDAATTNGDVRFSGTLRPNVTHTMVITGGGNIDLALPPYLPPQPGQPDNRAQPYRIYATTSANPIITDYPPTVTVGGELSPLTICGFIYSDGPYDYHIENTPVRHFGRIEVSPAATSTFFFSGTLGADYYRFDTDRPNILIYAPVPQSIHIYTSEQLNQFRAGKATIDPGCEGALNPPAAPTAIIVNVTTGRGRVYLRHIFRKED